ncbi:MAG: STT3 domain-containing protein [Candidatus Kariarchaeaceae archaeon]|jgi:dolichyl-diphosphooligosaccharide--protein glycosyltransferase
MAEEIDLGEWFSERISRLQKKIKDHFDEYDFNRAAIAHNIALSLILIIAFVVRLFPTLKGWDPTIKAFDPHMQLRAAHYILDNGFKDFLLWWDTYSWYPSGRTQGSALYIAVPLSIVFIYKILTFIGFSITVEFAAYLVPVIFGTIGVYYSYLLGKELVSPRGGLISAIVMAVIPAYVSRSIAGFVDNESVGVLFTVMAFYYFSKAFLRDSNKDAVLAGISLALLSSSWGAFRFAYDLLPLFALVIVITGNFSVRFLKAYVTTVSIGTMLMIMVPRIGANFLSSTEGIAAVGMIAFLVLFGIMQNLSEVLKPEDFRKLILFGFLVLFLLLGGFFLLLLAIGSVNVIGDKFISVILPESRNALPLIDSVSEHLPLAWGNLYANLSTLLFFIPLGIYFAMKNPSERNLFSLTFGISTIYFSGSMVRLMLILAPAAAILTAIAVDNLLMPYAFAAHGRIKLTKTTMTLPSIGGQNAAGSYLIVFALLLITLGSGVDTAADLYSTPELTPGQDPTTALMDWPESFDWMRQHTSFNAYTSQSNYSGLAEGQPPVMLSWWDYGYYITAEGETISLADNATSNSTQIGAVGTMLMWNSTAAINLMFMYNVQYVLVVPAAGQVGLGSDIGKSIWMIRISEQYTPEFGIVEEEYFSGNGYVDKYFDSVLYNLMAFESVDMNMQSNTGQRPPFYGDVSGLADVESHQVSSLTYFTEVFRSKGIIPNEPGNFPLIRIFRVDYPEDIELRVNEFKLTMAQIRANM